YRTYPRHFIPCAEQPRRLRYLASRDQSVAGVEGLEPPTPGFGDRCSSQLSYTPIACSILSRLAFLCSPPAQGGLRILERVEGNRTLVLSLEGCCSAIELHPHPSSPKGCVVEGVGFEPT